MKFKLVEKFDETRSIVQEYMYDAMDELNNASLEEYIQWFESELTYYDDEVERAVTDAYIEACDYGMIKGVEKTRLTSELKEYIESHTDIIDDTDELMNNCPEHLRHELQLALDVAELNESLNERFDSEKARFTPIKGIMFYQTNYDADKFQLFDKMNTIQKLEDNYFIIYNIPEEGRQVLHQTLLDNLQKQFGDAIKVCPFTCVYDPYSDKIFVNIADVKFSVFKKLLTDAAEVFYSSF